MQVIYQSTNYSKDSLYKFQKGAMYFMHYSKPMTGHSCKYRISSS